MTSPAVASGTGTTQRAPGAPAKAPSRGPERPSLRRNERLRLPGLGATLLPRRYQGRRPSRVLRPFVSNGRAQQHFLRTTDRAEDPGLAGRHAGGLSLRDQGPAGRLDARLPDDPGRERAVADRAAPGLRPAPGSRPLSRPGERPAGGRRYGRRPARGAPPRLAARDPAGDGVPAPDLAHRRNVRRAAKRRRRARHIRAARRRGTARHPADGPVPLPAPPP